LTPLEDTTMNEVYLLIGGNMGDRETYLRRASQLIEKECGELVAISSVYETAAWGKEDQHAFLNQALQIQTKLSAPALLRTILLIEEKLGRKRDIKYGPRVIDIDIQFFNDEIIDLDGLKIPHPRMAQRRFVLAPLQEIAPGKLHPVFHKTISQLLADCPDLLMVNKIS
jgi:2-amino-4-hydroxy-6-hydroxymethyldihydropteridine diphosphokinase